MEILAPSSFIEGVRPQREEEVGADGVFPLELCPPRQWISETNTQKGNDP